MSARRCPNCYRDIDSGTYRVPRCSCHTNLRTCQQCQAPMNPVDRMLGPVCRLCCRANERKVTGR